MTENKYRYSVSALGEEDFDEAYKFSSTFRSDSVQYLAEEAADHFHSQHDGWECSWPLTFTIWDEEGNKLDTFIVDRESVPEFHAYKEK